MQYTAKMINNVRKMGSLGGRLKYLGSSFKIQPKKFVDKSKSSIQLMMEIPEFQMNIDYLEKSKQLGTSTRIKLFHLFAEKMSLGTTCKILSKSLKLHFEFQDAQLKFIKELQKFLVTNPTQYETLDLHLQNNLKDFISIVQHIQIRCNVKMTRFCLAFLAEYLDNFDNLNHYQKSLVVSFLCERGYVPQNIIQYLENFVQDHKELKLLTDGTQADLIKKFVTISNMLQAACSLSKGQPKLANLDAIRKKLETAYFSYFSDNETFQKILNIEQIKYLFITDLFPQNKQKFFKMYINQKLRISKIFTPVNYNNYRMNENITLTIFDMLLLKTNLDDRADVVALLKDYERCIISTSFEIGDPLRGSFSLIMLCKKFQITSKLLLLDIYYNYLKKQPIIDMCHVYSMMKKNRIYVLNKNIERTYEYLIILDMAVSSKASFSRDIHEDLQILVQKLSNENYSDLLSLPNYEQARTRTSDRQNDQLYENSNTISLTSHQLNEMEAFSSQIENKKRIKTKYHSYYDFSMPIDMEYNMGAKLKNIFQVILQNSHYRFGKKIFSQIFYFLLKNSNLSSIINENKLYPGLAQTIFLIYEEANYLGLSLKDIDLKNFIESNEDEFGKKMGKSIAALKINKEDTEIISGIESLNFPSFLSKETLNRRSSSFFLGLETYIHIEKSKGLLAKVTETLNSIKTGNPKYKDMYIFPNNTEFPFLADCSIFCNNKKFTILIVSPEERGSASQYLKKIRTKDIKPKALEDGESQQNEQDDEKEKEKEVNHKVENSKKITKRQQMTIKRFERKAPVILISTEEDTKSLWMIFEQSR